MGDTSRPTGKPERPGTARALSSAHGTMARLEVAAAMGYLEVADAKALDAPSRVVATLVRQVQRHA